VQKVSKKAFEGWRSSIFHRLYPRLEPTVSKNWRHMATNCLCKLRYISYV